MALTVKLQSLGMPLIISKEILTVHRTITIKTLFVGPNSSRYKLQIKVSHNKHGYTFVFWDRQVETIVSVSAADLHKQMLEVSVHQ